MGDINEFLQKSYNIKECKKYLPKIYDYYNSCSVIFPNYVKLHESKYIYKNIRKKQKVIDNQQEQEEKQEKIKKGEIKYNEKEDFLTTRTFYSILDQSNTSNIKLFFGINDKVDINETPNNIVEKLKKAEKDAIKKKIQLIKNNSKLNIKEINNLNNINNSNININKRNNSKIFNKNKSIKERNKNNNNNIHYLSHIQHKKKYHTKNNSNVNIKINLNDIKTSKIKINNYLSKDNDSKKYIKSSSSINDTENEINKKKNYITFYENNLMNSKKKEIKKFIYDSNNINHNNIFINSRNASKKNIKKKFINSLLPTKTILSRLFSNFNNSILAHNSYINKKLIKKHITEENRKNKQPSASPSNITIQANSFRKKNKYNIKKNINLKESKSTRNIINNKFNINNKSKEFINLKNIQKINRNMNINHNYILADYNSNTLPTSANSKIKTSRERIKNIHKNNTKNAKIANNYSNFKTIINSSLNSSRKILKNNSNSNYANNTNNPKKINYNNMQKINSTTNIKNPMNMNININMNNNFKNKIYLNDGSGSNPIESKLFSKSPFNFELETIKVTKRKRIIYPKKAAHTADHSSKKVNNKKSQNPKTNNDLISNKNSNSSTMSKDKNNNIDSFVHTSSNSNNINDEFANNGFSSSSTINYINTKKDLILEEVYKKKNIIMPYKKEINNINININGYNINGGSLTSRVSKNKNKKNNVVKENYYNNDSKAFNKNKKSSNLMNKMEGNPIKIKKIYDNIKNGHMGNNKSLNNRATKKK